MPCSRITTRPSRGTLLSLIAILLLSLAGAVSGAPDRPNLPRPISQTADSFTGKVVAVSDGDTISVLRSNREMKVRLFAVDCPEKSQHFGMKAKEFTSELVYGQEVTVRSVDRDKYERLVAWVELPDGRLLQHELLKAGLAWYYRYFAPKESQELGELEGAARAASRGLWSRPDAVPPWEYRREMRREAGERHKQGSH